MYKKKLYQTQYNIILLIKIKCMLYIKLLYCYYLDKNYTNNRRISGMENNTFTITFALLIFI